MSNTRQQRSIAATKHRHQQLPPRSATNYYAVHKGHAPGVYFTWDECLVQTKGCKGAVFKKFKNLREATEFVKFGRSTAAAAAPTAVSYTTPPASTTKRKYQKKKTTYSAAGIHHEMLGDDAEWASSSDDSEDDVQQVLKYDPNSLHIYTDGSCIDNGSSTVEARGGVGVYFGDNDPRNISEPLPENMRPHTNQLAELYAICKALELCLILLSSCRLKEDRHPPPLPQPSNVVIHTDSMYSINCLFRWYDAWKKNSFRLKSSGQPVKYAALIQSIKLQISSLEQLPDVLSVRFVHEKGHSGVHGNEMADRLAFKAACSLERKSKY